VTVNARIRQVIFEHAHLAVDPADLADDDDLYQAGMTSHASISLMLGLEREFDVEFPDRLLTRSVFTSVSSISSALAELQDEGAAA
jgi:acyl carrier protein